MRDYRSRDARLRTCLGNPFQLEQQIARGLPAVFRIFRQTNLDGAVQSRWCQRLQRVNRLRVFFEDRGSYAELAFALKCPAPLSPSRTAPSRTRKYRSAHPLLSLPLARATCIETFQRPCPAG